MWHSGWETRMTEPHTQSKAPRNRKTSKTKGSARRVLDRAPAMQGWHSTDAEEIERRRWRGKTEIHAIEEIEAEGRCFGTYGVQSASGASYAVEIRSLDQPLNSCG